MRRLNAERPQHLIVLFVLEIVRTFLTIKEKPVKIKVSRENFWFYARAGYWVCVGLFVVDVVVGLYMVDNWSKVPGLLGWMVWGFLTTTGFIFWLIFRRRALREEARWSETEGGVRGSRAEVLRDFIYSWVGILIVGIAGVVVQFTGAGVPLILSAFFAVVVFLVSYPVERTAP